MTAVEPDPAAVGATDAPQSPREARRLQRIELSREQILDTAEELFAENGYYETGLKDVAARCEFSVGSIYSFFENKDSLYEQVLMRRSIGLEAIHKLVPDSVPADERLVTLAEIQIRNAQEHPAWGALTAELSRIARSRGTVVPEPWHHYGERVFVFLVGVFEKGHEEGTLRPGSPQALASLYHAVLSSFILVSSLSPKSTGEDWPEDTEEFLNFVRDTFSSRTPSYLEESAARRRRA
ncbi:TetR/AcrR family transcriptional regulator [Rhodococcoides kyotonense]|uniref:TetR/AcrR family transcriptional regulator n=1 Tax=Rhodococcoides kyotonense TaxID=398843 RepID=UPI001FE7D66D|nr:TetR/AcrR family transcriptional regulator [Rhodococcus kyotonensis]